MDENILTNDSREEDENGRLVRTPNNNIKNQNSINNQSKKMKNSGKLSQQKSSNVSHNISQQQNLQRPKTQMNGQRNNTNRDDETHLQSMDSLKQGTPNSLMQYNNNNLSNKHNLIDQKVKRSSQRPFSGGIQKIIKPDSSSKSRVQNMSQKNYAMYDQKNPGNGIVLQASPNKFNSGRIERA